MKYAFDYTEQARPLTMRQIKDDLDRWEAQMWPEPDKIVMWEHQLDWLIKQIGGVEKVASHLALGVRIWSIPLEVRKS